MKKRTAGELMTRSLLTVAPDWSIDRLMEFLTNNGVSGAPVVSDDNKPIGVVSLTDVARNGAVTEQTTDDALHYHRRLEDFVAAEEVHRFRVERDGRVTVRDIMTPMVFAVDEETPVQEVAEMMITGRIHRVFVKHRGKLTGVVTSMDLLLLVREM